MPEKIAIAVAGVMTVILGVWAKVSFVKRREVFDKDSRPLYQFASECGKLQEQCHAVYCVKIEDLKAGQTEVRKELKKISEVVIRLEERMMK
jgi:hypothetical protein